MTIETSDQRSPTSFELTCPDCQFEKTVEGDVHEALAIAKEHREAYPPGPPGHFVDFRLSTRDGV